MAVPVSAVAVMAAAARVMSRCCQTLVFTLLLLRLQQAPTVHTWQQSAQQHTREPSCRTCCMASRIAAGMQHRQPYLHTCAADSSKASAASALTAAQVVVEASSVAVALATAIAVVLLQEMMLMMKAQAAGQWGWRCWQTLLSWAVV